ncbi:UNVERIFIED_CONTAM: hypothetical protein Sindi_2893200 [Sesamum indicum]
MNSRGRGSSSYRGRGGRGKIPEIISQNGKQKLIAMDLSQDPEYQAFLEYKKGQQSQTEGNDSPSYAKIIGDEESESNNIGFSKTQHKEIIFLLEEKDLKWKNDPWVLMQRYLDNSSLPARTYKSRYFYEQILVQNGSCEISHFTSTNKEIYNFSKMIIKKVIPLEDWGISPMKDKEILINKSAVKYNYWDYCDAFMKVLDYENDKHKHSWFIKVCANVYNTDIPHWFIHWFYYFGPTPNILPEKIKFFFDKWVDISPQLIKKQEAKLFIEGIASCFFFIEFSIPWIWKWTPEIGQTEAGIPCLYRISHIKFWDKMMKTDPNTKEIFGKEIMDLLQMKISVYENQKEDIATPSPFDHISRKFKMKSEFLTKEQMVAAYVEEMKKDLMAHFGEDNKSTKSDSTMASEFMQDAQDPNDVEFEDIFEAIKETLVEKIHKKDMEESSSNQARTGRKSD